MVIFRIEFFLNWQIWHFCHSCTKLTSQGFKISKKIIASTGYWTHNTNPTIRIPAPLTTLPPRHLLNRISLNWTWIISGSTEHDFKRVWKFETCMDWQIGWVGKVAGILIVGLVLWVQYPVEAIFFCWFWNPVMSILYKNDKNVRSVNLGKTRLGVRQIHFQASSIPSVCPEQTIQVQPSDRSKISQTGGQKLFGHFFPKTALTWNILGKRRVHNPRVPIPHWISHWTSRCSKTRSNMCNGNRVADWLKTRNQALGNNVSD